MEKNLTCKKEIHLKEKPHRTLVCFEHHLKLPLLNNSHTFLLSPSRSPWSLMYLKKSWKVLWLKVDVIVMQSTQQVPLPIPSLPPTPPAITLRRGMRAYTS